MEWWQMLGVIFGPAGAAYAGVRAHLNGTAKRVERIETKVDDMQKDITHVRERVTRVEVKLK